MPDVFNRQTDVFAGAFPADRAKITIPNLLGGGNIPSGLIVQNMQVNYQQRISRVYQATSSNLYYVAGRTAGDASIAAIAGPGRMMPEFYRKYGDVCHARTNTLHFSTTAGCDLEGGETARSSYTAHFVVIQGLRFGVTAEDMLINESLNMMFSALLRE